jgi:hypothetical protein
MTVDSQPAFGFLIVPLMLLVLVVAWAFAWWLVTARWPHGRTDFRLRHLIRVALAVVAILWLAAVVYTVVVPTPAR